MAVCARRAMKAPNDHPLQGQPKVTTLAHTVAMTPPQRRRASVIYHHVRFAMKPEAPKEQVDNALELLRRRGRELDVVELFCVGRDFGDEFTVGALYALKDITSL